MRARSFVRRYAGPVAKRKPAIDAREKSARVDIVLDVFGAARCSIIVGVSLADAWAHARAQWPDIDQSYSAGDVACVLDVDDQCVVLLPVGCAFSVFAHEAVHVATWIMRTRGIPCTGKNEEVTAYLVQWVIDHGWAFASTWAPAAVVAATSASALDGLADCVV